MKRILTTLKEKWPEYLIESIVIIASILGAFALDNWNENRKEQKQKSELIGQLTTNYEANLLQLNQSALEQAYTVQSKIINILALWEKKMSLP
ncbi:MAG: hypothetical protein JXR10_05280 [Cyclobacteriaceae bacterium]